MSFSVLLPYLLAAAGGWLVKHLGLIESLLGKAAGPNPIAPASPKMTPVPPGVFGGSHPVLSDAVNAAIKQAVADVVAGHVTSIKGEIQAAVTAAVAAAVADLQKPKS